MHLYSLFLVEVILIIISVTYVLFPKQCTVCVCVFISDLLCSDICLIIYYYIIAKRLVIKKRSETTIAGFLLN